MDPSDGRMVMQLGYTQRLELKLGDISESFGHYAELELILERLIEKVDREGERAFRTENLHRTIRNISDFDDFINELIENFINFFKEEEVSRLEGLDRDAVKKALRLACYLAFVGHFGVERREQGLRGGQMDYFLHPIFAAFFEIVYRVGFPAWEMGDMRGDVSEVQQKISVIIAIILHDLFEDFKKGKLIAEVAPGITPEQTLEAFHGIIQKDIPQALGIPAESRDEYGEMLLELVNGVTKPEDSGRLQALLHFLAQIKESKHGKGIVGVKMSDRVQNGNTIGSGSDTFRIQRILAETRAVFIPLLKRMGNRIGLENLSQILNVRPETATAYYHLLVGGGGDFDIGRLITDCRYRAMDALPRPIGPDSMPHPAIAKLFPLTRPETYPKKKEKARVALIGGIVGAEAEDLVDNLSANRSRITDRRRSFAFGDKQKAYHFKLGQSCEKGIEVDAILGQNLAEVQNVLFGQYGQRTPGRVDLGSFNPDDHIDEAMKLDAEIRKDAESAVAYAGTIAFLRRIEEALTAK